MADPTSVEPWIAMVKLHAVELRSLGVLAIGIGEWSATFAPPDPPPVEVDKNPPAVEEPPLDPLNDPASYPGGQMPGFTIEKMAVEE